MSKRKIAVVITSRASYARVKSVLTAIKNHKELELLLIGAASLILEKYGNAYLIIEEDGFEIREKVYTVVEGSNPVTMAKTVGLGITELATIFNNHKPDIVISIADRFETIATAIAGSYLNIPIAHIQGGELTGSIDEKVRHAVTKMASIHFVANEQAEKRVRKMGESPESIFVTGCPSIDLALEVRNDNKRESNFMDKYGGTGTRIDLDNDFIIVMQHSVTTEYSRSFDQMWETLLAVKSLQIPVIVMWPNVDAGSDLVAKAIRTYRERYNPNKMHFFRNMDPCDFIRLLLKSRGIVGNSSVGIRECSFLGVPAVNIGTRQNGRERGENVFDVGYDRNEISKAVKKHILKQNGVTPSTIYGNGKAGEKIAEILGSVELKIEKRFED